MTDPVTHATFHIERRYEASPERVFLALSDPEARRRWFMEGEGFKTVAYEPDFRRGAREYFRFTIEQLGRDMVNVGYYHDIVPNRRIVSSYEMAFVDEAPFSASLVTIELAPDGDGTAVRFTEQGAYLNKDVDHAAMREEGWKQLLGALEREIAGQLQPA